MEQIQNVSPKHRQPGPADTCRNLPCVDASVQVYLTGWWHVEISKEQESCAAQPTDKHRLQYWNTEIPVHFLIWMAQF